MISDVRCQSCKTLKENPEVIEFLQKQLGSNDSRREKRYSNTLRRDCCQINLIKVGFAQSLGLGLSSSDGGGLAADG